VCSTACRSVFSNPYLSVTIPFLKIRLQHSSEFVSYFYSIIWVLFCLLLSKILCVCVCVCVYIYIYIYIYKMGPGVAKWLRRCATSRTVPRSIPGGITWDFFRGSFRHKPCALKRSTRDCSLGKGGRCVWLTTYYPCSAERGDDLGP
jgi:hypothetical protein